MNKQYRVYNKRGEYHHAYNASLEDALSWAIDCAKRVNGSVTEISNSGKEQEIFNCKKETTCSH
jgi:hypothetical protein